MARDLGSSQLREFEEVRDACFSCKKVAELPPLMDAAVRSFGFPWFALVDDDDLVTEQPDRLMMTNYPPSWVDEFLSGRLYRHDPVHAASLRSATGLSWDRIPELIRLTRPQRAVLGRGRTHGVRSGYTVPFRIPGERGAFFTLARSDEAPFTSIEGSVAQILGGIFFHRARELVRLSSSPSGPTRLSPRQIDCLQLIAIGKTEWEISGILGLSRSTVHDYVESARRRFDVRTRSQLVLAAARDGYIPFNYLR